MRVRNDILPLYRLFCQAEMTREEVNWALLAPAPACARIRSSLLWQQRFDFEAPIRDPDAEVAREYRRAREEHSVPLRVFLYKLFDLSSDAHSLAGDTSSIASSNNNQRSFSGFGQESRSLFAHRALMHERSHCTAFSPGRRTCIAGSTVV